MKKEYGFKRTSLNFIIFFIVIALHAPIYHQHIYNHHSESLKHTDNITPHSLNDYSINSHETIFETETFTEESHTTHYHLHFDQIVYRISRIDTNTVKTISDYTFDAFNNLPTHPFVLKKHSYAYYKTKHYSNNHAKTSSGLSPPIYSS